MKKIALLLIAAGSAFGTVINTTNATDIAAFQSGATVQNFSSVTGVVAQPITAYTNGATVERRPPKMMAEIGTPCGASPAAE